MKTILTVGVKELKNKLSEYLREVRRGTRVLVTERNEVIAELSERPKGESLPEASANPVLSAWLREGWLRPARRAKQALPLSPLRLPAGTASRLVDEDRGE